MERDSSQKRILKGHKNVVNCLDISAEEDLVATGSSDCSVRIWDIRQARACHCITGCFASSVDSLAFSTTKNNEIFASSGRSLFSFDLRNSKVVVNNPLSKISDIATDDINSIAVHPSGQYLAMTDDNCTITILNMTSNPPTTNRISNGHTNIIGSLSFKPNNKKELATGGFDFNVCFWDFQSRILKGSHSFSRRDLLEAKKGDNQQFFNPPFVQAINYMCGGKALVCALGDGSIKALCGSEFTLLAVHDEAHNGMVTAMRSAGEFAITGGIDRTVRAWRLDGFPSEPFPSPTIAVIVESCGATVCSPSPHVGTEDIVETTADANAQPDEGVEQEGTRIGRGDAEPESQSSLTSKAKKANKGPSKKKKGANPNNSTRSASASAGGGGAKKKGAGSHIGTVDDDDADLFPPVVAFVSLWSLDHGEKVNALCGSRSGHGLIGGDIFVSDVSADVTVYVAARLG